MIKRVGTLTLSHQPVHCVIGRATRQKLLFFCLFWTGDGKPAPPKIGNYMPHRSMKNLWRPRAALITELGKWQKVQAKHETREI